MIDIAVQQLLVTGSKLPAPQVTPSTNVNPTTQALPRVAYTLLDDPTQYTDSGAMALRKATYQLDIFAGSPAAGRSVQSSVTARADNTDPAYRGLDGYRGTVDQTQIQRIWFGSNHDGQAAIVPGQNQTIARLMTEMYVVYRELLVQPNFTL